MTTPDSPKLEVEMFKILVKATKKHEERLNISNHDIFQKMKLIHTTHQIHQID